MPAGTIMYHSQPVVGATDVADISIVYPSSQVDNHYCEVCLKYFKSKHGLKVHKGKAHKPEKIKVVKQVTSDPAIQLRPSQPRADNTPLWEVLTDLRQNIPVVKRIPRGARAAAANALRACIDKVVSMNSADGWRELLTFSYRILHASVESQKGSLTQRIKNNCQNPDINCHLVNCTKKLRAKPDSDYNMLKRVETKISEGDLRGAGQLLFSTDALAPNDMVTLEALKAKHPTALVDTIIPDPSHEVLPPKCSPDNLLTVIMSFKNGSSGGLDGLTPQHLKDLVCVSAGDSGRSLLVSLASLVEHMLCGKVLESVVDTLYGASLCALSKKDGGIRPIAMGTTLRRIAAKIACRSVVAPLAQLFQPTQVGCGAKGGCEATVHATRAFLQKRSDGVLLKVDVCNAFNTINRSWLLSQVQAHTPSLLPFLVQCYGSPSNLVYQNHLLKSGVGCQQGDPLGPVLFSLGIHPHITTLRSSLNVWYLDDGTLGGDADTVLADLGTLKDRFGAIGLELNCAKCELYIPLTMSTDDRTRILADFESVAPGIRATSSESLHLLGAPLTEESVPGFVKQHVDKFRGTGDRLCRINAHMAMTLIKFCLFVPKFVYILRCSQLWRFESLLCEIDNCIADTLSKVLNVNLSDKAWTQASLPVRFGGLGIRRASDVALPAFLSSAWGCRDLFGKISSPAMGSVEVAHMAEAQERWCSLCPGEPVPTILSSQKLWDEPLCRRVQQGLLNLSQDAADRARLLAVFERESGLWLNAIPSSPIGTVLDNTSLSLIVGLRLGLKTVQPHACRCGQAEVDELGHHGLRCRKSAGRIPRHALLNDVLRRALASANVPATLEPNGIVRSDGKRPDGVTHVAWKQGKFLAWDVTCVDTLAPSHIPATSENAGTAAAGAETIKCRKYEDLQGGYMFVPAGFETMGPWGPGTKKFVKDLSVRLIEASGDRRAGSFLGQRLSLAVQRGNAACLLGTMEPRRDALDDVFYL